MLYLHGYVAEDIKYLIEEDDCILQHSTIIIIWTRIISMEVSLMCKCVGYYEILIISWHSVKL